MKIEDDDGVEWRVLTPSCKRTGITTNYWTIIDRKTLELGISLVAQWLGIHLPMQGTGVWALVQEDPTCHGATKPVRPNYWACALEPVSHSYRAHVPQLLKPIHHNYWSPHTTTTEARMPRAHALQQREATTMRSLHTATKSSSCSPQLEKAHVQQWRPNTAKNKISK